MNKVCASSIRAVEIADSMIRAGDVEVVVTGGMESMSNAPYALPKARFGYKMGDATLVDLMIWDGLRSTFDEQHMVQQAARVARELGISREAQDEWALRSHERAAKAQDDGRVRRRDRPGGRRRPPTRASAATRRSSGSPRCSPVMDPEGTITAGNAPGVNDGASCVIVCSEEFAKRRGLEPLATIVAQGYVADEFAWLARTPANAGAQALQKAGKTIGDVKRVEVNEAFSSVALNSVAMLGADPETRERERRRGRARPPDRRERRPDPRHDGARAAPQRRRARACGDLLGRRAGRRAPDRGLGTSRRACAVFGA